MTAQRVAQHLLEEGPGVDPKDLLDRYYRETQPDYFLAQLRPKFEDIFERLKLAGVLELLSKKFDAETVAQAMMLAAIDKAGLRSTQRAYTELIKLGKDVI